MQTQPGNLNARSPAFVPRCNKTTSWGDRECRFEQLRLNQTFSYIHSNPEMAHFQSSRMPSHSISLTSLSQFNHGKRMNAHSVFHQGENGTNFVPPMSYDSLYNENSSMAPQTTNEPDLSGGLYHPDANGLPSGIFPPQMNQSLAHQPVRWPSMLDRHC